MDIGCKKPSHGKTLYTEERLSFVCGECHDEEITSLRTKLANAEAALVKAKTAIRSVLDGFEKGFFVRSTKFDGESDWAVKLLPYLVSLGKCAKFCETAEERAAAGDGEG